jgi:hypothetical protein
VRHLVRRDLQRSHLDVLAPLKLGDRAEAQVSNQIVRLCAVITGTFLFSRVSVGRSR